MASSRIDREERPRNRDARAAAFGLALATSLVVAFLVYRGSDSPWLAVPWVLSLVPFALSTRVRAREALRAFRHSAAAILLLAAGLPVL
jgi:predicted Na+-dependent transporter